MVPNTIVPASASEPAASQPPVRNGLLKNLFTPRQSASPLPVLENTPAPAVQPAREPGPLSTISAAERIPEIVPIGSSSAPLRVDR